MGSSRNAAQAGAKIERWVQNISELPDAAQKANLRTAEHLLTAAVRSMSGDMRLSHVGRSGAPVGVKTERSGNEVFVGPKGPVQLVENPSEPHLIGAGRGRLTTRGGRSVVKGLSKTYNLERSARLRIGNTWVTGPIIHPGVRVGKKQWKHARDDVLPPLLTDNNMKAMTMTMEPFR